MQLVPFEMHNFALYDGGTIKPGTIKPRCEIS